MGASQGRYVMVVGPTGVGKNTMVDMFLERHSDIAIKSVSTTTRAMREHESEGNPYNFISEEEFKKKIDEGDFLEYAFIHAQQYSGTPKKKVLDAIDKGLFILNDIEYQGVKSIQEKLPRDKQLSIFLLPPESEEALRKRIEARGEIMTEENFQHRLDSMKKELEFSNQCDHVMQPVEGDIEATYKLFEEIIMQYVD